MTTWLGIQTEDGIVHAFRMRYDGDARWIGAGAGARLAPARERSADGRAHPGLQGRELHVLSRSSGPSMTPIARGQAIEISMWPPSPIIHACWRDDAKIDSGEIVVVSACGIMVGFEDAHETDAAIDCMTCLVRHEMYDQDFDEDIPH